MKKKYTINPGDYLVIWITSCVEIFIAEVIESNPLRMKVMENGPYANLKDGDFIILDADSEQIQKDNRENTNVFLERLQEKPPFSGLKSLGVGDNQLREILPG